MLCRIAILFSVVACACAVKADAPGGQTSLTVSVNGQNHLLEWEPPEQGYSNAFYAGGNWGHILLSEDELGSNFWRLAYNPNDGQAAVGWMGYGAQGWYFDDDAGGVFAYVPPAVVPEPEIGGVAGAAAFFGLLLKRRSPRLSLTSGQDSDCSFGSTSSCG